MLSRQYEQAGRPVLFIEYSVNDDGNQRIDRWYSAYDQQRELALPFVTVDSGWRWSCGGEDYDVVYPVMIEEALANPPGAELGGSYWRDTDDLHVRLRATNRSSRALGPDNYAAVSVIVYEQARLMHTGRFSRASAEFPLGSSLPDGDSALYELELNDVRLADWGRAVVVGVLDFRPDAGSERYAALQSAVLEETAPPTRTASAVPSPTASAAPTETPTVPPTDPPTVWPTSTATPEQPATAPPSGTPSQLPASSPTPTNVPSPTPKPSRPVLLPIAFVPR